MSLYRLEICIWSSVMIIILAVPVVRTRMWKSLYMDSDQDCTKSIRNDGMDQEDYYQVDSDSNDGRDAQSMQRPAECGIGFNFGDRLIGLHFRHWQCDKSNKDAYLGVYDDCNAGRQNPLLELNCSISPPTLLIIRSSCVYLYHYRGHTQVARYSFSLHVAAREELIAFPVGNIAGIIVGIVVVSMVIVKIVCVISGYERRMPDIFVNAEEQKQLFQSFTDPLLQTQNTSDGETQAGPSGGAATASAGAGGAMLLTAGRGHRVLRVSRSSGSANSGGDRASEHDYDYFDIHVEGPPNPRLKRYPSVRASSFLRK